MGSDICIAGYMRLLVSGTGYARLLVRGITVLHIARCTSGKTHFWIFRGFSWIFADFWDFLDFLDFNSVIQTDGLSARLSADLDFNPAKVS